jgi:hypothetical protein
MGSIANDAITTGVYGCEQLYVGRAPYQGSVTVGKIHPSQTALFIAFNGCEIRLSCYEVLCWTSKNKGGGCDKKKKKKRSSSSSSSSSD